MPFLAAKLKTARYFADTLLADSGALHDKFISAGSALQDLDPELCL